MARSRDLLKFRQDERSGPLSYGMDKPSAQRRPSTETCGGRCPHAVVALGSPSEARAAESTDALADLSSVVLAALLALLHEQSDDL